MIRRTTASLFLLAATAFAAAPTATPPQADPNHKPTVWLIGDSTVRNGSFDNGATAGQWGWGHLLHYYFDTSKVNVVNDAMGGTSSKSFQESAKLWPLVISKVQPGDFVLMQFGHNDSATPRGNGDETTPGRGNTTNHTFGWYMRQYIEAVQAKGATPIVCSLIPRNNWTGAKVDRGDDTYGLWARQAAEQDHALFLPLNTIIADKYDKLGREKVTADLFPPREGTHTNWKGAVLNAQAVVEGIKDLKDCPLKNYLVTTPVVPEAADITTREHGELGPDEAGATRKWESSAAGRAAAGTQPGKP